MKKVLTIAGSDPAGGAGIQADLKAIATLGCHGMTVITTITAQNSLGINRIYPLPLDIVAAQIDALFDDMGVDAVKTGMLTSAAVIRLVAERLAHYEIHQVVVDPIIAASDGTTLLDSEGLKAIRDHLFPLAILVTPNIPEAEALSGMEVNDTDGMREAIRRIHGYGARGVLLKGGHMKGDPVDLFFDGEEFMEFRSTRSKPAEVHGTGCVLSATIAAALAKGYSLHEAVRKGREVTLAGIRGRIEVGKGRPFVNPLYHADQDGERYRVLEALKEALALLQGEPKVGCLLPEVSSNLGFALPLANNKKDVAAFPGRIIRTGDGITTIHPPSFGASEHIASVILTAMEHEPAIRSAINIRYTPKILDACARMGFSLASFDRSEEPVSIKEKEGSTLAWGVQEAFRKAGGVPDVIWDNGGWGKEGMIRILGRDPLDVVRKVIAINRCLR